MGELFAADKSLENGAFEAFSVSAQRLSGSLGWRYLWLSRNSFCQLVAPMPRG
jgi:hypothetical protein